MLNHHTGQLLTDKRNSLLHAAVAGGLAYAFKNNPAEAEQIQQEDAVEQEGAAPAPIPRENAVMVLGSTGKIGTRLVKKVRPSNPAKCTHQTCHELIYLHNHK